MAGVPEARNEEESLVAFRLGLLEANMRGISEKLDTFMGMVGQVNLIDHRLKELEKAKQRIMGSVGALTILVIGQIINNFINRG
jgi:hypothetical protein